MSFEDAGRHRGSAAVPPPEFSSWSSPEREARAQTIAEPPPSSDPTDAELTNVELTRLRARLVRKFH